MRHRIGASLVLFSFISIISTNISTNALAKENKEVDAKKEGDVSALTLEVDLQDIVAEAMKTQTTVQEAPAIVTVIPEKRIKDMGYRYAYEIIGDVPGFFPYEWVYGVGLVALPRGILAGALILRDGLDVVDMGTLTPTIGEHVPVELLQRAEVISGPGGVLWGSNSFVGVINLVSKTADDLQGIEASAGYGTGPGRPNRFKAYVMGGQKLFNDRLKVLAYMSYETWQHGRLEYPHQVVIRSGSPQPQMPNLVAGPTTVDAMRSQMFIAAGNAQLGPLSLHWEIPWGYKNRPSSFAASASHRTLDEDSIDCSNPNNKELCLKRVDPDRISRKNIYTFITKHALLKYQQKVLNNKLRIEGRGFYVFAERPFNHYSPFPPSTVLKGGLAVIQDVSSHRFGGTLDGDWILPKSFRLLFGGELYYDYMPEFKTNFLSKESMELSVIRCPRDANNNIITDEEGRFCPVITNFESNRITGGLFLNVQTRIVPQVILDAGARVQLYGGKRSMDPTFLASGGAVWTFLPEWHLKLNYAEGFRPPPLQKTDSNGEGLNWTGGPFLEVEKSRALQGEINTRLLRGYKSIRQLGIRADYSYTWITDFIESNQGIYANVSKIGIHSAELLLNLQMKKGHWFSIGYTFLDMADSQKGKVRSIPNQWFTCRALVNLWRNQLFFSSNLSITGSVEDPNKYPTQVASPVLLGDLDENGDPLPQKVWNIRASDLVMDRINPMALWNAGVRFVLPRQRVRIDFDVYNLLNAKGYYGEGFMDLTSYLELQPQPRAGISFFAKAQYQY